MECENCGILFTSARSSAHRPSKVPDGCRALCTSCTSYYSKVAVVGYIPTDVDPFLLALAGLRERTDAARDAAKADMDDLRDQVAHIRNMVLFLVTEHKLALGGGGCGGGDGVTAPKVPSSP